MTVSGEPGDYVSLLPWGGDAEGVSTEALRYPLRNEPLTTGPSRGLSNELTRRTATVRVRRGALLVVHTRRAGLPEPAAAARAAQGSTGELRVPQGRHFTEPQAARAGEARR
jgi:hypothetical protein